MTHMIGQCRWQTEFDDTQLAAELQDFISQWSHYNLADEIEPLFEQLCPQDQTWRLERLELDLGDIHYDELAELLPQKLQAALLEQFSYLLNQPQSNQLQRTLTVANKAGSEYELIHWFLIHGVMPWWHSGYVSVNQVLQGQLAQNTRTIKNLVTQLGQQDKVRQRLAYQFSPTTLQHLVEVLEPHHAAFIVDYVEQLQQVQAKQSILTVNHVGFRQHTWYWVLTHLLVDKGSLFNTQQFVRSTIWQMAQHFQLDYHQLLQQLHAGVAYLQQQGLVAPQFLSVLDQLVQQEQQNNETVSLVDDSPELLTVLANMLTSGQNRVVIAQQSYRLAEVFTELAHSQTKPLAHLLFDIGSVLRVRQTLIDHLSIPQLSLLVEVLLPTEHQLVLQHVSHTQHLLQQQSLDSQVIWQILLAHILDDRGSYFNRRQFVADTLWQVANSYDISYLVLLEMMIQTPAIVNNQTAQFQLLVILQDLHTQVLKRTQQVNNQAQLVKQLKAWWCNDEQASRRLTEQNYSLSGLLSMTVQSNQHTELCRLLADLFNSAAVQALSDQQIQLRLQLLLQHLSFSQLVSIINPEASELVGFLQQHLALALNVRSQVIWLGSIDSNAIESLLLLALVRPKQTTFIATDYLSRLFNLLADELATDIHRVKRQFHGYTQTLALEQNPYATLFNELMQTTAELHGVESIQQGRWQGNLSELNLTEKLTLLLVNLESNSVRFEAGISVDIAPVISRHQLDILQLIQSLAVYTQSNERQQIADWLSANQAPLLIRINTLADSERQAVNTWLLTCVLGKECPLVQSFQLQLQQLIQQSGLWQGSASVLQQQLALLVSRLVMQQATPDLSKFSAATFLRSFIIEVCFRLNLALEQVLLVVQHQLPVMSSSDWRQVYQSFVLDGIAETAFGSEANESREHEANTSRAQAQESSEHSFANAQQSDTALANGELRYLIGLPDPVLVDLIAKVLFNRQSPSLLHLPVNQLPETIVFELLLLYPSRAHVLLNNLLSKVELTELACRLQTVLDTTTLLKILLQARFINRASYLQLTQFLACLHAWQFASRANRLSQGRREADYFHLLLTAWLAGDSSAVDAESILRALCNRWRDVLPADTDSLNNILANSALPLPDTFARAWQVIMAELQALDSEVQVKAFKPNKASNADNTTVTRQERSAIPYPVKEQLAEFPIPIQNAGLVLLSGFFNPLFSRLGLLQQDSFISQDAQLAAVHHLQFLATGMAETEEPHLVLNKILSGLPLHQPVPAAIEITSEHQGIAHSLIESIVNYWSAIGASSIDGFRGNWLVRSGTITERKDHWDLIVEKRPYDVLLARSPLSYSIVKFPWMEKPIYVTWPT